MQHEHDVSSFLCTKGRVPHGCATKEHVIILPPRLTKSAYQTLIACNVVPRPWHLEGRFGSRTHDVPQQSQAVVKGIPVLYDQKMLEGIALQSQELRELLDTDGVSIVEKGFVYNHRAKQPAPELDARIHPELEPDNLILPIISPKCMEITNHCRDGPHFIYAEMFGGIGGFGVALDFLGGKCMFYSEIDERCRQTYKMNFDTPNCCIHGDIYKVPDSTFPQNLDFLVAGFPCQPFSTLGEQPGFECDKGRGNLYLEIVRALKLSQPKAFLFENVPGLLGMTDALTVIVNAFRGAGYKVTAEMCSSRGLTATNRKRLFFVGIREDLAALHTTTNPNSEPISQEGASSSPFDSSFFQYPYVPDLKLCSHDILDYDSLPTSELEVLRLSQSTFTQLSQNNNNRWKPHQLAWPDRHCDTLTSHYGNAVGRGGSQLVPSCATHPPRRLSVRECARIMGFPNTFAFPGIRPGQGEMAHIKEGYRMIGNAVCPPLIAALAGRVLDVAGVEMQGRDDENWTLRGRRMAMDLASAALRPTPVPLPMGCLIYDKKG